MHELLRKYQAFVIIQYCLLEFNCNFLVKQERTAGSKNLWLSIRDLLFADAYQKPKTRYYAVSRED
jgi:hypothetical protein